MESLSNRDVLKAEAFQPKIHQGDGDGDGDGNDEGVENLWRLGHNDKVKL